MGTEGFRFSILMKTLLAVFFKILCIYLRERVHAHAHERGGREGQKERDKQTPRWVWTWSQDPEVMTWAEGRRLTDWATQAHQKTLLTVDSVGDK